MQWYSRMEQKEEDGEKMRKFGTIIARIFLHAMIDPHIGQRTPAIEIKSA